ncbi:hypothetical protein FD63_13865 [Xanthomonas translucens pv. undulosa]|nr:hypothetical protein FD63_13865 [Xanthomonas translucens pv. undulosa]
MDGGPWFCGYGVDWKLEHRNTGALISRFIAAQYTTKSAGFGRSSSPRGQARVKTVDWAQRRHALEVSSWVSDSTSINAISRESGGAGSTLAAGLAAGADGVMAWGLGGGWLGSSAQARRRFFATFQKRLRMQGLLVHMGQAALGSGLGFQCLEALSVGGDAAISRLADAVVSLGLLQALPAPARLGNFFALVTGRRAVQRNRCLEIALFHSRHLLLVQTAVVHARVHARRGKRLVHALTDGGSNGF